VVFEHADRILVLNRGSLIAEGFALRKSAATARCAPSISAKVLCYDARHREGAGA
jgi:branched-chain amino acid transport system ATP-binding protein